MIIGIPHYNDIEGLYDVIITFMKSTDAWDKIIILNSDDKLDNEELLNYFEENGSARANIEIINTPKEGPLKAYNRLFKIAKERKEDLFLTQTDVTFPNCRKDWLAEVIELSELPTCGMITCHGGGGVSGPDFIDGFNWVGAWCTYIPYRTIEKLGGYDENIPLGWGVDIDYSYAVIKLDLNIYQINYWVDHNPNYEEGHEHEKVENIEQLKKDAYTYMRKKWKVGEFVE